MVGILLIIFSLHTFFPCNYFVNKVTSSYFVEFPEPASYNPHKEDVQYIVEEPLVSHGLQTDQQSYRFGDSPPVGMVSGEPAQRSYESTPVTEQYSETTAESHTTDIASPTHNQVGLFRFSLFKLKELQHVYICDKECPCVHASMMFL